MEELLPTALRQPFLLLLGLFLSLLAMMEIGRFAGRRFGGDGSEQTPSTGLMTGAIFALLGLLIALTFSNASTRLDNRRALAVEEANAIGTAKLRLDLLPADARSEVQTLFDAYTRSRAEAYERSTNLTEFRTAFARSAAIQQEIWDRSVAAGRRPDAPAAVNIQLLPALNAMIDITTTRAMAMKTHTPLLIFAVIGVTAWAAALLSGYAGAPDHRHRLLHMLTFAGVMTIALYVLIDLEHPRVGLIRMDGFDDLVATGRP